MTIRRRDFLTLAGAATLSGSLPRLARGADNAGVYDLERFGLRFVASPRHADMLLVTGPVTSNMREALERTYEATPNPKWVVAVGDCAINCGVFADSYACAGPVSAVIPVDLEIQGCPPAPINILRGLVALLDRANSGNSTQG